MLSTILTEQFLTLAKKNSITQRLAPKVGKVLFNVQKVSPELCLAGGIVAGIATVVMAAKAHGDEDNAIAMGEAEFQIAAAKDNIRLHDEEESAPMTSKERAQVLMPAYGQYVLTVGKIYGPSAGMGLLSIYLILTSHGLMKGRTQALVAALKLTETGFRQYRERVIREYGEDVDERFFLNANTATIVDREKDPETGKTKKTKRVENVIPENGELSMYSRIFDATNPEFHSQREMNEFYLRTVETYFNDMLTFRGYLFLNEVYAHLHIEPIVAGQIVGWSTDPKIGGDNFVDFGLDGGVNRHPGDNRFILDFNVNGSILASLPEGDGVDG